MKLTTNENGDICELEPPFRVFADCSSLYVEATGDTIQHFRETVVSAVNACHGLDIPTDITPGAVAALVAAARAGLDYLQRTNPLEHGNPDLGRTWGALEEALAPFSKDLLPPPPADTGHPAHGLNLRTTTPTP
jgi:hypothetical protein